MARAPWILLPMLGAAPMHAPVLSWNLLPGLARPIPPVVQKAAVTPLGAPSGAAVAAAPGRKWTVKVKPTDAKLRRRR